MAHSSEGSQGYDSAGIDEAVALARHLQERSADLQAPDEKKQLDELYRMIQDANDKATVVQMTDEAFRAETPARAGGVSRIYIDGSEVAQGSIDLAPEASLDNEEDFVVARGLPCTFDFLRFARGTLADSMTNIDELYAWQFTDSPPGKDFTGRKRNWQRTAPGAIDFDRNDRNE